MQEPLIHEKKVLITGANRGLGLELAKKLSAEGYQIYATARDQEELKSTFDKERISYGCVYGLDLFDTTPAKVAHIFDSLPPLSSVIHCASPYTTKTYLETPIEEIEQYTKSMFADHVIMKNAVEKLKTSPNKGTLVVTGAVIGLPHIYSRGIMGLVKLNQRQLAAILEYECAQQVERNVFVRHFTLGSFRDEVAAIETDQYISTDFVAETIHRVIEKPENYSNDICLLSSENEEDYGIRASFCPERSMACKM